MCESNCHRVKYKFLSETVLLHVACCILGSKNEDHTLHWDVILYGLVDGYHWFGGTSEMFVLIWLIT
jgi:hypothetical protein